MKKRVLFQIILFILIFSCNNVKDEIQVPFEKLSNDVTGINFSNIITPDIETSENLFDYDYFYNGSGVCIADINNDGLKDVLFTANQEMNRLFLNKGNLTFEDISELSNINTKNNSL